MSELKTKVNDGDVNAFLDSVPEEQKQADSRVLLNLFEKITGEPAKMWGSSIIGFGQYHYKSERSSQEGDWPLTAFSPRKANLTLYLIPGFDYLDDLLDKLGKHKTSKGCLYINRLSDIDMDVLKKIIDRSFTKAKKELL